MHLRALLSGAFVLTAAAAAQEAPQACQAKKACDQTKAVVVSVAADDSACASASSGKAAPVAVVQQAAGDCAASCASTKAAPVAIQTQDCESACSAAAPVALTGACSATAPVAALPASFSGDDEELEKLRVELGDLEESLESLNLDLDIEALLKDIDLSELGGHVAIRVSGDGDYELLGAEDMEELDIEWAMPEVDLAVAADEEDEILSQLSALGYLADDEGGERGYLGVQMNLEGGLNVLGVLPGSGAAKAGLKEGDTIVSVNGKSTKDEGITEYLQGLEAGDTVKVVYARSDSDKLQKAKVKLMTLAAIEGGEEEPEEIVEEVLEVAPPERIRLLHSGEDFDELRAHVKDVVLEEIEGNEGRIAVAIRGAEGKPQIIKRAISREELEELTKDGNLSFGLQAGAGDGSHAMHGRIALAPPAPGQKRIHLHGHEAEVELEDVTHGTITVVGEAKGDGLHVFKAHGGGEGRLVRLNPDVKVEGGHITVEVDASGAPSQGFFFDARDDHGHGDHDHGDHAKGQRHIVIKRVENGEESVEEYTFSDGDDLPGHIREMLHEHGGGEGNRRIRVRNEVHDHDEVIHRAHAGGAGKVVIKTSINGNEEVEEISLGGGEHSDHVHRLLEEHGIQLHGLGDGREHQVLIHKGHGGDHDVDVQKMIFVADGEGDGNHWIAEVEGDGQRGMWATPLHGNHVLHLHDDEHEHEHDGHRIFQVRGPGGARGEARIRVRTDDGHGASIGFDAKALHGHLAEALKAHGVHVDGDHAGAIHEMLQKHLGDIEIEVEGPRGLGGQFRRNPGRNRIFLGGPQNLRGFQFHVEEEEECEECSDACASCQAACEACDDEDDDGIDELLDEIEELHDRIDRLEGMLERLGRRRR